MGTPASNMVLLENLHYKEASGAQTLQEEPTDEGAKQSILEDLNQAAAQLEAARYDVRMLNNGNQDVVKDTIDLKSSDYAQIRGKVKPRYHPKSYQTQDRWTSVPVTEKKIAQLATPSLETTEEAASPVPESLPRPAAKKDQFMPAKTPSGTPHKQSGKSKTPQKVREPKQTYIKV